LTLGEGTFVRQEIDNMGWVDTGDSVVVIDALEKPETEGDVRQLLEETVGAKSIQYLLNTHTHYDHVALNGMFRERFGTVVVNAQLQPIPAEGLWFRGTSRRVHFLPLPDCHTPEDCIAWVPETKVLFVGDIFGWGLIPWDAPLERAKADELIAAYERLIAFEADHVVPGHGPVCTSAELRRWVEYFQWLLAEVRNAMSRGGGKPDITPDVIPPPEDMRSWWRFCAWKHEDCLRKVAHAVRRDLI
jgi:cyclase